MAIGVLLFFLHPSVTYDGYNSQGAVTTLSGTCISPWNSWTEHHPNWATTTIGVDDQLLGQSHCISAIQAREHWGWTLLILGGIGIAGSFLFERHRRNEPGQMRSIENNPLRHL